MRQEQNMLQHEDWLVPPTVLPTFYHRIIESGVFVGGLGATHKIGVIDILPILLTQCQKSAEHAPLLSSDMLCAPTPMYCLLVHM